MSTNPVANENQSLTTLAWPGKGVPEPVSPGAIRLVETFEPARLHNSQFTPVTSPPGNAAVPGGSCRSLPPGTAAFPGALYFGDNLPVMSHLLAEGRAGHFRLIYADPPYDSGVAWTRKVRLRGPRRRGEDPVIDEQAQYADTWRDGEYLQFMYARLHLMRDLLAADGSLWLHCDHRRAHHLRCLLDEVFGARNYLNTITWRSQTARGAKVGAFFFPNSAQTIHIYGRNRSAPTCWNPPKKQIVLSEAMAAAEFMRDDRGFFRTSDPGTYSFASLVRLHGEGRLYAPYGGEIVIDEERQRVYPSNGGNIGVKYHLTDLGDGRHVVERAVDNIWDDIPGLGTTPGEDLGYPTQKTLALLERIVKTATAPGDWVLDPFAGSGTTLAAAQRLGRNWVGIDGAAGAIRTAVHRMQGVAGQPAEAAPAGTFGTFSCEKPAEAPSPDAPQLHFSIIPTGGSRATIGIQVDRVEWTAPFDLPGLAADWRRGVDSIVIDPAYDGQCLRVALADAPPKRAQLVAGTYTITVPTFPTTVAVRVTDIWGRSAVMVKEIL